MHAQLAAQNKKSDKWQRQSRIGRPSPPPNRSRRPEQVVRQHQGRQNHAILFRKQTNRLSESQRNKPAGLAPSVPSRRSGVNQQADQNAEGREQVGSVTNVGQGV